MTIGLIGRKRGMTRVFTDEGDSVPVTVIEVSPNRVTQVKTVETDGYNALQVTLGTKRSSLLSKPQTGHFSKAEVEAGEGLWELRLSDDEPADLEAGAELNVEQFEVGQHVDVTGTSKGKGFAGVMKRYNFGGMGASHGVERKHRSIGSIASHGTNAGTGPKLKKGKRMCGHMGTDRTTSRNHRLIAVDKENNLLLIKGSVPGPNGALVQVRVSRTAKVKTAK